MIFIVIAFYLAIAIILASQVNINDPELIEIFGKLSSKQVTRLRLQYIFWPITFVVFMVLLALAGIVAGIARLYETIRKAI